MSPKAVSTERLIAAPADRIFAVLADPRQHTVIDGSGTVKRTRTGPDRLSLGAKFGMAMHHWVPYPVTNTVVEFEEDRRIAWRHMAHDVWRYELEPRDGGTLVRETFDWSHGRFGMVLELTGIPKQNLASMEKTLDRLAAHVESGPPTAGRSGRIAAGDSYTAGIRRADRVAEGARLLSE